MLFFVEISWELAFSLHEISSALVVEKLLVLEVDQIHFQILSDQFNKFWYDSSADSICAVNLPMLHFTPAQVLGGLIEV